MPDGYFNYDLNGNAVQTPVGGNVFNGYNYTTGQTQTQQSAGSSTPNVPTGLIRDWSNIDLSGTVFNPGTANAIDQFGHNVFGIGNQLPSLEPLTGVAEPGPITEGLSGNFSPANIGAGIVGGIAANKIFGGGIGTNVGSTIGGIAGSFGGPIGTAVGSFIGGGIGSMFGNKEPSNRVQNGGVNFATGDVDWEGSKLFSQQGDKFSAQNAAMRDSYATASSNMIKYLRSIEAEQVEDVGNLVMRFGDRDGYNFYFEKIPTSDETVDFRGSARNKELMEMPEESKGTQNFGHDISAFTTGLSGSIISKFNLTPEQAKQAQAIFNSSLQETGMSRGTGGSQLSAPIPMVAARKSFPEFMSEFSKAKIKNENLLKQSREGNPNV